MCSALESRLRAPARSPLQGAAGCSEKCPAERAEDGGTHTAGAAGTNGCGSQGAGLYLALSLEPPPVMLREGRGSRFPTTRPPPSPKSLVRASACCISWLRARVVLDVGVEHPVQRCFDREDRVGPFASFSTSTSASALMLSSVCTPVHGAPTRAPAGRDALALKASGRRAPCPRRWARTAWPPSGIARCSRTRAREPRLRGHH